MIILKPVQGQLQKCAQSIFQGPSRQCSKANVQFKWRQIVWRVRVIEKDRAGRLIFCIVV